MITILTVPSPTPLHPHTRVVCSKIYVLLFFMWLKSYGGYLWLIFFFCFSSFSFVVVGMEPDTKYSISGRRAPEPKNIARQELRAEKPTTKSSSSSSSSDSMPLEMTQRQTDRRSDSQPANRNKTLRCEVVLLLLLLLERRKRIIKINWCLIHLRFS